MEKNRLKRKKRTFLMYLMLYSIVLTKEIFPKREIQNGICGNETRYKSFSIAEIQKNNNEYCQISIFWL